VKLGMKVREEQPAPPANAKAAGADKK